MNHLTNQATEPSPLAQAGDALRHAGSQGTEALRHAASAASDLAHHGLTRGRGLAGSWHDGACDHIRSHPLRSVAIAAGGGAILALLLRMIGR